MKKDQVPGALSGDSFFGINILEGMYKKDFWNLYGLTSIVGILIMIPAILQPAFLREVIGIPRGSSGSINTGLQNMSQIATLLFIGYVGSLSDKFGRIIIAFMGFIAIGCFFLIFGYSKSIADFTGINPVAFVYLCRFLVAVGFVMTWPQFSILAADYTSRMDRGKAMAYNGLMMGFAGIIVFTILSKF